MILILHFLDYLVVAVFAISGAFVASRKEMDLIGFSLMASLTGIGGGTVRDILLGRHAFGAWLALFGADDAGEHVMAEDGRKLRRLEPLHRREYRSVFGLFELWRAVYGTREGQKIEHVPLDERLQLPQGKNMA